MSFYPLREGEPWPGYSPGYNRNPNPIRLTIRTNSSLPLISNTIEPGMIFAEMQRVFANGDVLSVSAYHNALSQVLIPSYLRYRHNQHPLLTKPISSLVERVKPQFPLQPQNNFAVLNIQPRTYPSQEMPTITHPVMEIIPSTQLDIYYKQEAITAMRLRNLRNDPWLELIRRNGHVTIAIADTPQLPEHIQNLITRNSTHTPNSGNRQQVE